MKNPVERRRADMKKTSGGVKIRKGGGEGSGTNPSCLSRAGVTPSATPLDRAFRYQSLN